MKKIQQRQEDEFINKCTDDNNNNEKVYCSIIEMYKKCIFWGVTSPFSKFASIYFNRYILHIV